MGTDRGVSSTVRVEGTGNACACQASSYHMHSPTWLTLQQG